MPDAAIIDPVATTAAAAGAVAGALANRGPDTRERKVVDAIAAWLIGTFCGPGICELLKVECASHLYAMICCGTGAAGVLILTLFLDWAKGLTFKDWLARWK